MSPLRALLSHCKRILLYTEDVQIRIIHLSLPLQCERIHVRVSLRWRGPPHSEYVISPEFRGLLQRYFNREVVQQNGILRGPEDLPVR